LGSLKIVQKWILGSGDAECLGVKLPL